MKKQILILIDKDATLIYDTGFPGSRSNWKEMFELIPTVEEGLKKLSKIPNSKRYIVTNQAGVAIKEFHELDEDKSREVCEYTIDELNKKGANISGYEICPYVEQSYLDSHPNFEFDEKYVLKKAKCRKPNTGMADSILKKEGLKKEDVKIYVIGDRKSDVQLALNLGGFGILVPIKDHPNEPEKVRSLKSKNTYIAKNFLDAAEFILKRES